MAPRKGPTLRAQWLGKQLRELREAAKLTLREAGDYVQRDQAAISRWEQGLTPARAPDVLALLNLYGVDDPDVRDGLERLSRDIWQKGWWDDYAGEASGRVIDHAWLESRAEVLRSFDMLVIPGLLQTPEYAEAVIRAADPEAGNAYISRWVQFRMIRQRVLAGERPIQLAAILDEALLCRVVGGAPVMRAQFEHITKLGTRPHISIRVLPFSAGAHASPRGPFMIFNMPAPYPDIAFTETGAGCMYVESDGVGNFTTTYDYLDKAALTREESAELIAAAADRMA
ncbi:helix-turn-helix transcriptional regulator [Sphaerisporangium sp. NPDC005288]|uniref:helix-turn-helix domain-containing protein n=1 Tax=Sphaerisporangium sp. NPDC005288 TaxID=3155114 RepID=UPI0033A22333